MTFKNKLWLFKTVYQINQRPPLSSLPSSNITDHSPCTLQNSVACTKHFNFCSPFMFRLVSCKNVDLFMIFSFFLHLLSLLKMVNGHETSQLCAVITETGTRFSRILLLHIEPNMIQRLNVSQDCDQDKTLRTLFIRRFDKHMFFFQEIIPELVQAHYLLPNADNIQKWLFKINLQQINHMPISNTPLLRVVFLNAGPVDKKTKLLLYKEETGWLGTKNSLNMIQIGSWFSLPHKKYLSQDIHLQEFLTTSQPYSHPKFLHLSVASFNDDGESKLLSQEMEFKMATIAIACGEIHDKKILLERCKVETLNDQVVCTCTPADQIKNITMISYFVICVMFFWFYIGLIIWQNYVDQTNSNQVGSEQVFWVLCSPKTVRFSKHISI